MHEIARPGVVASEPAYRCSVCGVAVVYRDRQLIRACTHATASVVTAMQARATGDSRIEA